MEGERGGRERESERERERERGEREGGGGEREGERERGGEYRQRKRMSTYTVGHTCMDTCSVSCPVLSLTYTNVCTSLRKCPQHNLHVWRPDLHSSLNVKYSVRCLHSWLPLNRNRVVG